MRKLQISYLAILLLTGIAIIEGCSLFQVESDSDPTPKPSTAPTTPVATETPSPTPTPEPTATPLFSYVPNGHSDNSTYILSEGDKYRTLAQVLHLTLWEMAELRRK